MLQGCGAWLRAEQLNCRWSRSSLLQLSFERAQWGVYSGGCAYRQRVHAFHG